MSLLVFRARRPELRSLAVYASVLSGKPSVFGFWTVLHGVAAASEQLKAKFRLRHVVAFRLGAGAPTNSVTTRMRRHSISPARAISARTSKASSGASAGCNEFVAAQDTPTIKKTLRVSESERTPPTLASHILVRRGARSVYPRQHLTTLEVGDGSRPPFLQRVPRKIRDAMLIAVDYSFA